jgi:hypothetical protein
LASGFPINFDGGVNAADPWKIQLTMGIMFAGLLQSTGLKVAGIHRLDPTRQLRLLGDYVEILGEEDRELKEAVTLAQLQLREAQRDHKAHYRRLELKRKRDRS